MSLTNLLDSLDAMTSTTREEFKKSVFAYPGSKYRGLKYILPHLPYTDRYVEVFGGTGVVLSNRKPVKMEVFNDRYGGLIDFYRCIRDSEKLKKMLDFLNHTLHSREEFLRFKDELVTDVDPVIRAAKWFYVRKMSFGSIGRNFGRNLQASSNKLLKSLPEFYRLHERFKNVLIENLDWRQCIADCAHPDTVFYLDPPYMVTTTYGNIYKHADTFTVDEHREICDTIFSTKGFFALSSYENELYFGYKWDKIVDYELNISLSGGAYNENNKLENRQYLDSGKRREFLFLKYQ